MVLADQQSYFSQPPLLSSTNKPASTNLAPAAIGPLGAAPPAVAAPAAVTTNLAPAKPGFIAELCIPEDAEGARRVLKELVNDLNEQRLFAKVDSLSDDLRREVADPKVVLHDRRKVLALDFAQTDFQAAVLLKKPVAAGPARGTARRPARPAWPAPESAESPASIAP